MDQYREGYQKAQLTAKKIMLLKKNEFLNTVINDSFCINDMTYYPSIAQWYELKGFRLKADKSHSEQSAQIAVSECIRSSNRIGASIVYTIAKKKGNLKVLYGTSNSDLSIIFKKQLPECDIRLAQLEPISCAYNGLILGTVSVEGLADIIASVNIEDFYVSCIVSPISDTEIQEKILDNKKLLVSLQDRKSFQRVYGNGSRRVEEVSLEPVTQAISLLKEEQEFFETYIGQGFVRTIIKFGANYAEAYNTISSLIQSCMHYENDIHSGFEPVRYYTVPGNQTTWNEHFGIPFLHIKNDYMRFSAHITSLQPLQNAVSFCIPPMNSYYGYYIKNYHIDENDDNPFNLTEPFNEAGVEIGKIIGNYYPASIPLSGLYSHAFISGATNSGKSTTIKKILVGLYAQGIPFLVLEAAKKEYISLINYALDLKVYTPGIDGNKLLLNPLQPENGVLIENHVDAVVRAITASHGSERPIPEALSGLLKQTYQKSGWEYGTMAYHDVDKPFPTFKEVFINIKEYIANHAQYGPEVRQNLTAALMIRIEELYTGALGNLFINSHGLMAKDLLDSNCIIELSDFSEEAVSFIMNILLFKIQSYLSKHPESKNLKRVIVVEEAHNIFRKTLIEDSGRALNNNYFEKMLAEIRSSGTGIILSDQRPSIMSGAVIANSSVKIVHSMDEREDRNEFAQSLDLTGFQVNKIRELQRGECIVSVRGIYGLQHVSVEELPEQERATAACHICFSRFNCKKNSVRNMLISTDWVKARYHLAKIKVELYNIPKLSERITVMLQDLNISASNSTKCCFLGEILQKYENISFQESRIIVNSYSKYLRRAKDE